MDKLQPLITHIFWILFGVALLLPTVGWWMGTGSLQARIEEQETAIDGAFKEVKNNSSSPNDRWTDALKQVNEREDLYYQQAALTLQGTQNDLRTWHESVAPMLKDIPYKGPIVQTEPRDEYRKQAYWEELDRLAQIVKPYDPSTNAGLVILTKDSIPRVPDTEWQLRLPESDEMWNLQEDIWLLRGLLKSIASLNERADVITESPVREITSITLHGGDREALNTGATASGGSEASPGASFAGRGGYPNSQRGSSLAILPEAVFGPQTAKAAESGNSSDSEDSTRAGVMGRSAQALDRYVDETEGIPFKTRGFILKVVMDHRKVPELLVALTNCEWPGQILHVNQVDLHQDASGKSTRPSTPSYLADGGNSFAQQGNFGGEYEAAMSDDEFESPESYFEDGESSFGGASLPGMKATRAASASAAMADSFLAEVQIAGLLTIYDPPLEEALAAISGGDTADAGQTAAPSSEPAPAAGPDETAAGQSAAPAAGTAGETPPANPAGAPSQSNPAGAPTPTPTDPAAPASGQQPGDSIN